ncbi:Beige/BEACH domain [Forsythia ovata]|uniref:Beige/BEACH domain n=1 Tax=Forsythia ovata TaxID=205694 RepID=A0ABD1X493_9LAMI
MKFLERRLLQVDEENEKKLDKSCWSWNLDALLLGDSGSRLHGSFCSACWCIEDSGVLLIHVQLVNKDGRIGDAVPSGKRILPVGRGMVRENAWNMAVDILKYLLVHRRATLEDLLVSKPYQGPPLDVLHGGFDKLSTGLCWNRLSIKCWNSMLPLCGYSILLGQ